jgi:hypothetical protein
MFKFATLTGVFVALSCNAALAETALGADQNGLQLECKPQYVSAAENRDPIITIKLTLSDSKPQIVHVAQSGKTFNRADQYTQNAANWSNGQFSWNGKNNKKSTLTMVGTVKPISDDHKIYSYTESLFDAAAANAKTFEMFSVCTPVAQAAKKEVPSSPVTLAMEPQKAGQITPTEAQADAKRRFEFRRLIIDKSS